MALDQKMEAAPLLGRGGRSNTRTLAALFAAVGCLALIALAGVARSGSEAELAMVTQNCDG